MQKQNPMYDPEGRIRFDGVEILHPDKEPRQVLKYYCLSGEPSHKNQRIAKKHVDFVKMDAKKQNDIRERGGLSRIAARLYFAPSQCYGIDEGI